MDFKTLAHLANIQEPMPDGLKLYQQQAFQTAKQVYWSYRNAGLSRDDASAELRKINKAYLDAERDRAFQEKATAAYTDLWKTIEASARVFANDRTIENAERFYEAVYGCGLKHKTLPQK